MSRRQTAPPRASAPPRYKLALLSWVGAYAVITTILAVMGPLMATWPLLLRTLLLSMLMVVAMTWLVIPSLTRLFRGWLTPASPRSGRVPSPHGRRESTTGQQWAT
jgi:hypothetical protein